MVRVVVIILMVGFSGMISVAQISNIPGVGNEVLRLKKYEDITGSPYLYTDWKSGTVIDKNGKSYPNALIKYDAYGDAVELNQEGTVMILNNELYQTFVLNFADNTTNKVTKQMFRSGYTQIPGFGAKAYFEVLSEGAVMALKRYDIKFVEEVVNSYGTATATKRFQRTDRYFLLKDNKAVEFKLNSKSILGALGDKQAELDKYIAKEKLKLKTEDDLKKLMAYYNSL
jgi:hypothetical protein